MKKGGTAQYSGKSILALSCKLNILLNCMIKNICFSAREYLRETHTFLLWLCGTAPATQQSLPDFQKA